MEILLISCFYWQLFSISFLRVRLFLTVQNFISVYRIARAIVSSQGISAARSAKNICVEAVGSSRRRRRWKSSDAQFPRSSPVRFACYAQFEYHQKYIVYSYESTVSGASDLAPPFARCSDVTMRDTSIAVTIVDSRSSVRRSCPRSRAHAHSAIDLNLSIPDASLSLVVRVHSECYTYILG